MNFVLVFLGGGIGSAARVLDVWNNFQVVRSRLSVRNDGGQRAWMFHDWISDDSIRRAISCHSVFTHIPYDRNTWRLYNVLDVQL